MRRNVLVVLAVGLLIAANQDDAVKKELDKLRGTWTYESFEQEGQRMTREQLKDLAITFTGDKYNVKQGDKIIQAGIQKVDPAKKPKTLDIAITEGDGKGETLLGIYELEGDTLKYCLAASGKERPADFKAAAGSGRFAGVLKREKK
jgi:uncharacterized protein (TIGR03067 family)